MSRSRRRQIASVVALGSAAAGLAAFGCSLGLDPSLIGQQDAGVTDAEPLGDGAAAVDSDAKAPPLTDSATSPDAPIVVGASGCTADADCKAAAAAGGGCVTSATCDKTWHVCLLDVCGNGTGCQAEVCQASMTCTLPATYRFTPAAFTVSYGGVNNPQSDIAAAWPFVFVVTTNGVVAYNVFDPTNGSPPEVPVHGLPFIPSGTIAVGRRVYFVNGTQGGGPLFRQAIAWVDVPQNPFLTDLQATSAWVSTPDAPLAGALTNGADGLFFLYGGAPLEPAVNAHPPFADSTVLTPFPNAGLPTGAGIVSSTGTRLLAYRYDPGFQIPNFALVNGAGTATVQTGSEQPIGSWLESGVSVPRKLDNQYGFMPGSDGSVLWETAVLDEPDSGGTDGVSLARLAWLVDSSSAGNFDVTSHVDLASYSPPAGGQLVGQPAWVDPGTALGFAAPNTFSTSSTLVQIVKKSPPSILSGTGTSLVLGVAPAQVGVATSNGFAYSVAQTDPRNQTCTVQIFAPSCAGTDQ